MDRQAAEREMRLAQKVATESTARARTLLAPPYLTVSDLQTVIRLLTDAVAATESVSVLSGLLEERP